MENIIARWLVDIGLMMTNLTILSMCVIPMFGIWMEKKGEKLLIGVKLINAIITSATVVIHLQWSSIFFGHYWCFDCWWGCCFFKSGFLVVLVIYGLINPSLWCWLIWRRVCSGCCGGLWLLLQLLCFVLMWMQDLLFCFNAFAFWDSNLQVNTL